MGGRKINARAYVARFNFHGPDQQKKVGDLSGGERNRVHLAKLLRRGCNVLLLDEPTNDLDVDTLRALEEAILNFAGCVVVISHDRWFLDRIATHILAFEGDSYVHWCEGNFQTYEDTAPRAAGHRSRPAAPDPVQEAAALGDRGRESGVGRRETPSFLMLTICRIRHTLLKAVQNQNGSNGCTDRSRLRHFRCRPESRRVCCFDGYKTVNRLDCHTRGQCRASDRDATSCVFETRIKTGGSSTGWIPTR